MEYALSIGGFIIVIVALLLIIVISRPSVFRVERSKIISGTPSEVFAIINDFRQWRRWSPFERDPNMQVTLEGPKTGPGASHAWNGNGQVGSGKMTITESKAGEFVAMQLQFTRPFKCNNRVLYTMAPEQGGTRVAWIMEGENTFLLKAFSLFSSIDKMVGKDFEAGLNNLDRVVKEDARISG